MRINGPEMIPGKRVLFRPVQTSSVVKTPSLSRTDGSLSTQLARIFADKGFDIPSSQIQSLQAELSSLGMNNADVDSNNAVRALLLQRFSIPLTSEILTTAWETDGSSIFKNLSLLKENAISLLADKYITGKNREAVAALIKNIDAVFKGEISPEMIQFAADDIIDLWMYDLESKLISLTEGKSGSVSQIPVGSLGDIELALESLVKPHYIDGADSRTVALVEAVRNAVSEMRLEIWAMDFSRPEAAQMLMEAVDGLAERLSFIIGEYEALFPPGTEGEQSNILMAQFIGKTVNMLENRLLAQLLINTAGRGFTEVLEGEWSSLSLRNIILKSGMSFEWQLLAWYRSGRDPGRFYALLHNDLKGTLIDFVNRIRKNQAKKGRIRKKLELLEKQSQNLTKHITNSQFSNIFDNLDEKRGIYLEVPLGTESGHGHARIRSRGGKKPEENSLDPENMTLNFEIETSNIGTVSVFLVFSGKAVTLRFELEDKTVSDLAKDMHQEIRDALISRGFSVGSIDFIVSERTDKNRDSETIPQTQNLDIVG